MKFSLNEAFKKGPTSYTTQHNKVDMNTIPHRWYKMYCELYVDNICTSYIRLLYCVCSIYHTYKSKYNFHHSTNYIKTLLPQNLWPESFRANICKCGI